MGHKFLVFDEFENRVEERYYFLFHFMDSEIVIRHLCHNTIVLSKVEPEINLKEEHQIVLVFREALEDIEKTLFQFV